MYGFFATISALAEIWSLTAVSLDRLQAINNPLNAQKRITKSQVLTIQLQLFKHKVNRFRLQVYLLKIYVIYRQIS